MSLGSFVSASEYSDEKSSEEKEMSEELEKSGVPKDLIILMPEEQKLDIISSNLMFDSYEKVSYSESIEESKYGNVATRGTISENRFDLYISVYKLYPYNSTKKKREYMQITIG